MDEIDKLLAGLTPEPKQKPQPSSPPTQAKAPTQAIDDLLKQFDAPQPSISSAPQPDRLLQDIKADYEQQQEQLELEKQQQVKQKQQRLEQLKVQRRAELAEQAATWLKALNLKSTEGQWFEEFSCNYESRLEAAIDYLEALKEVTPD